MCLLFSSAIFAINVLFSQKFDLRVGDSHSANFPALACWDSATVFLLAKVGKQSEIGIKQVSLCSAKVSHLLILVEYKCLRSTLFPLPSSRLEDDIIFMHHDVSIVQYWCCWIRS